MASVLQIPVGPEGCTFRRCYLIVMPPGVKRAPSMRTAPAAKASVKCKTPDSARGAKSRRSMTRAVGSPATNRSVALRVNDAAGVRNVSLT
jgi:hypothetical protein